jgi:hypothetical protein
MEYRDISDPVAWVRKVNPVWRARHDLDQAAEAWLDHLARQDPRRLEACCTIAAVLTRGPGYGGDPKPWFYGGLFSLATREEAERFLADHRLTAAVIPALAHTAQSEQWVAARRTKATRDLIARVRANIAREAATRWPSATD